MKSAIEDIINGRRGKLDQIKVSEKYKTALHESSEAEHLLLEKMQDNAELLELYRKLCDADEITREAEVDDVYKGAFRFAFLIAVDVFCGEE